MDRRASINGKTAPTAATIDHGIATLWNPSATKKLTVYEIHIFKQTVGAADEPVIRRTTARGTAGSSITSTIVHDSANSLAPPSGAILDMAAYTVQPTISAGQLHGAVLPAAIGSGMVWSFAEGVEVPAGNGLGLFTGIALAFPVSRVTFVWGE